MSLGCLLRAQCARRSVRVRPLLKAELWVHRYQHLATQESRLPRVVQPSIWQSVIPKALRGRSDQSSKVAPQKKSNPANYFIWIYILIGSQAIRILQIKNEHTTFMRKADLQLAKLREVIEKLQRGEEVDVEKILGTGDEVQEQAWEDALREIETEERLWQTNKEQQREASKRALEDKQDANPVNEDNKYKTLGVESAVYASPRPQAPGFY